MSGLCEAYTLDDLEGGDLLMEVDSGDLAVYDTEGVRFVYGGGMLGGNTWCLDAFDLVNAGPDALEGFVSAAAPDPEPKSYSEAVIREVYRFLGTSEGDLNKLLKVLDWASAAEKLG